MRMCLILAATAAFVAGNAAADTGLYVGGSVGQATIETSETIDDGQGGFEDVDFDEDDIGYKIYGGWMFLPFLGVEGGYIDFGTPEGDFDSTPFGNLDVETEADGWEGYVVGMLPLGPVELFAKAGLLAYDVEAKVSGAGNSASASDSGEELAYGVGASIGFGNLKLRAEYQLYDVDDVEDLYMISAGLTFNLTN